ncbi:hypothetical protein [Streptomyces sp. NPDC001502]|uniref:hypothetical protein n=1 Tax=Streptomyces sp. NPDC001502 TaxID=3364578 RepID=UPI00368695EB
MREKRVGDDAADAVASPPVLPMSKPRTALFVAELGVLAAPHLGIEPLTSVNPAAPYAVGAVAVTVMWPHVAWLAERTAHGCKVLCLKPVDKVIKYFVRRGDTFRAEAQSENSSISSDGPPTQEARHTDTAVPMTVEAPPTSAARALHSIPQQTMLSETAADILPTAGTVEE